MDLIIKNGTVVTPSGMFRADVGVQDGKIVEIAASISAEAKEVADAAGKLVLPGAIDGHTHLAMPFGGTISSDDYFAGTRAAACGGTTTVFDFAMQDFGESMVDTIKRRDAMCAPNEEIDKLGYPELVYTTGEVVCHPCVHTCVPDYFDFSFDARHEDPKVLEQVLAIVKACAHKTWAGCTCKVEKAWNRDTVYWDKKLVGYVKAAAEELGVSHQYIHSGAGHDAQFAAYMLPTTMIFVQSKDGLSHCEPEYSSPEHCTEGASVMLNAVLKADAE